MKKLLIAVGLLAGFVLTLALGGGQGLVTPAVQAQAEVSQIEPGAGSWRTWVLESGSQLHLPAPPETVETATEIEQLRALVAKRDARALDQIAYWDAGAPTYRWNQMAVNETLEKNQGAVMGGRSLALVNAAMYDATIAAYDSKYAYGRERPSEAMGDLATVLPNPRTPSYPSERAAVAGAASVVMAYLFPDKADFYMAQAEAAAQSRLLAGVSYPSDVAAGLKLGRAVGAMVVERAKNDGTAAKWTGSVPQGPGMWNGTNPAAPLAGTWKTWVLKSGSEVRPAPPIPFDSAEKQAEMAELKSFKLTPRQISDAYFWEYGAGGSRNQWFWSEQTTKAIFDYGLDQNPPRAARAYALESIARYDAMVACWDAKYAYWAIRPVQLDTSFKTLFNTPGHPSYPSAHSCLSTSAADTLSYLFPRNAEHFQALAEQASESRLWAGLHYRSDIEAGTEVGRAVAEKVIKVAETDGSQAMPSAVR